MRSRLVFMLLIILSQLSAFSNENLESEVLNKKLELNDFTYHFKSGNFFLKKYIV